MALAAAGAHAADASVDAGMKAVQALGRINGVALACGEQSVAAQAKALMIKHAPRSSTYGDEYQQATQRGFAEQTNGGVCPPAQALARQVDAVAADLQKWLPQPQ